MNDQLTKDAPHQTLLQPDDPWITPESDVKPYILEPLDNIKLSRWQYIATSTINYGPINPIDPNTILTNIQAVIPSYLSLPNDPNTNTSGHSMNS